MSLTISGTYYSKTGPRKYEAKYYISSDEKEPFLVFKFQGGATSFRNILIPAGVHFRYDTREILYEELFQEKDGKQAEYQEANVTTNILQLQLLPSSGPHLLQNMGVKDTMRLDFSETLEELSEEDKELTAMWPTVSSDAVKQLDDSLKLLLKANPIDLEQRSKDIGGQSQKVIEREMKQEIEQKVKQAFIDVLWGVCSDLNKLYSSSLTPGDVLEILDQAEKEQVPPIMVLGQKVTAPVMVDFFGREKAIHILDALKKVLSETSGWETLKAGL